MTGLNCPRCNARIVHKSMDGKVKIRTSIVAFGPGGTEVICRKCGADVPVDVRLGDGLAKALDALPAQRLVVRT
jgi:transcription elongation factor Elf1